MADISPFAAITRRQEWGMYAASILSMSHHPGTTRDAAKPMTVQDIAAKADEMLKESDKRFGGDHG